MNYTEKNKLLDKISIIGLMAILVEVFLYSVNYCYTEEIIRFGPSMSTALNVIGIIFLVISIVLYIISYKKSNISKAIFGTEFLVLAFLCPFLDFWYTRSKAPLNTINPKVLWIIAILYYIVRIILAWRSVYLESMERKRNKKNRK